MEKLPLLQEKSQASDLDGGISRRLEQFVTCCSVLATAFGLWVLTGWLLHIQFLKTILPGQVAVKANTAACFILIGFALWVLRKEPPGIPSVRLAAKIAAVVVGVVGLLSVPECLWGWDLGIDQLLFSAGAEDIEGSVRPGLMSPITAFCFLALGLALLLLDAKTRFGRWPAHLLCSSVAIVSLFGVLDFVLDPASTHTHISPITAFALFLLAFGLMFSRIQSGLGALVGGATLGGTLTRRLLPAAILVPLVIAWLRWKGETHGFYSDWAGVALMTVFTVTLLASLTVWTGFVAGRTDRARRQGEEASARLAFIVNSSNDAIIAETLDGIVMNWNPGAEAIYGYSAKEMLGKSISIAIPPDRREEFTTLLKRIEDGQPVGQFETKRFCKDGNVVDVSMSISPLMDNTETMIGACTIARDISERKRAEEALRIERERLALALKVGKSGTFDWNLRNNTNIWSPEAEELHGLAPGTFGGTYEDWESLVVPEDLDRARSVIQESLRGGEFASEWRIRRHDNGEIRWIDARAKVFFDDNGRPCRMIGINVDITDRKRAEEKLRSVSLYTRSLIEASLDPLVTISREGKITDVNEATENVTGVSRAQLIGSDFCNYFTQPEEARKGYQRVFAEGSVCDYPLAVRHSSGRLTDIVYNATVFKNEGGEIEGVFAAARDITDRKRAEDEVRQLNQELEVRVAARTAELLALNKELESFSYAVAHDLRAPLRHIHGFSDLLLHDGASTLSHDAQHWLECVLDGTGRMGKLLEDLLNLSRLGRQTVNRRTVPLKDLVQEVIDDLGPESANRPIEWKVGELPATDCDSALARIVFANLLSNAVKFTRPRTTAVIEIGETVVNGERALFVRDNGAGFDMKYVGKLFGVFQRLHLEKDFEGTGVGLATVQRILLKHAGRIWAEAEVDKGATFYFTFGGAEALNQQHVAVEATV